MSNKKTRTNTKSTHVKDGLYISKNDHGKSYKYYFLCGEKQKRGTVKTGGFRKAAVLAERIYDNTMYEYDNGIISQSITFKSLTQKHLASIAGDSISKISFHRSTVKNHLLPFFEKYRDVSQIKNADITDYMIARRAKVTNVSNSTLNKEGGVFNSMMQMASKNGWVADSDIKIERLSETVNRRPHFTEDQLKTFLKVAKQRISDVRKSRFKGQNKGLTRLQHYDRNLVYDLSVLLLDTGMRPCELKSIKWNQINLNAKSIKLNGAGKVKSNRTLYIRSDDGLKALKRIKDRRLDYAERYKQEFSTDEYIQSRASGKRVMCIKKGFKFLVNDCGFNYEDGQKRHVMYSLRHTYATNALLGLRGKKISIDVLAKQMGTSIDMIIKHYGHNQIEDHVGMLTN